MYQNSTVQEMENFGRTWPRNRVTLSLTIFRSHALLVHPFPCHASFAVVLSKCRNVRWKASTRYFYFCIPQGFCLNTPQGFCFQKLYMVQSQLSDNTDIACTYAWYFFKVKNLKMTSSAPAIEKLDHYSETEVIFKFEKQIKLQYLINWHRTAANATGWTSQTVWVLQYISGGIYKTLQVEDDKWT